MEFTHLLKLGRQLRSPKIYQIASNSNTFALVNQFETKVLSTYVYNKQANELEHIKDFPRKKKILQLWQNGDSLCIIDKFGDVYQLSLSYLNNLVVNRDIRSNIDHGDRSDKNGDVKDEPFILVTNLFSVIVAICPLPQKGLFLCSDDYYRVKILSSANLQYIHKIFSLRPNFVSKILPIDDTMLFFFDDGKVLSSAIDEISRLDEVYSEERLIELGANLPDESFYNDILILSSGELCGWFYDVKSKAVSIHVWNHDAKNHSFVRVANRVIEDIEEDFFMVEDNSYLHTLTKSIDLMER